MKFLPTKQLYKLCDSYPLELFKWVTIFYLLAQAKIIFEIIRNIIDSYNHTLYNKQKQMFVFIKM